MKKRYILAAVAVCLSFILAVSVFAAPTVVTSDKTTDILFLVDCSGTVEEQGLLDSCESALHTFIDLIPNKGFKAAAVFYGNTWNHGYEFVSDELSYKNDELGNYARTRICVGAELTALSDENVDEFKNALSERLYEGRYTHGNNYLGGGLMAALDILSNSSDAAVVIITDGDLSGFDSTDGVEWKKTNRELTEEAVDTAASKNIKLYTIELNANSKNSTTSVQRQLMENIAKDTNALSRVITSSDMLKEAVIDIYADITGAKVYDTASVEVSELTSEISLVLEDVNSISVGGRNYKKGTTQNVTFTDNVFKMTSPSGNLKFTNSGGKIIKAVVTEKYPLVLELGADSSVTRNNTVEILAYFADPSDLSPVDVAGYFDDDSEITVNGERVEAEISENSLKAEYKFEYPGEYEISVFAKDETISTVITVEDYVLEIDTDSRDELYSDENVRICAYFTGKGERINSSELYLENEAFLTVRKDGKIIDKDIPMNAAECYYVDYTLGEVGEYEFYVKTSAKCIGGDTLENYALANCTDNFEFVAKWNFDNGESVGKSLIVEISAKLTDFDGNVIKSSRLLDEAEITAKVGDYVENIPYTINDGQLEAEWRVSRSGNVKLMICLADGEESSLDISVFNHSPILQKDRFEAECRVGEEYKMLISDYVTDEDGDIFGIETNGNSPEWTLSDDGEYILIDCGKDAGTKEFTFIFDDGDEKLELPSKLVITNKKPEKTNELSLPHFILDAPSFMFFKEYYDTKVSYDLCEYFSDPEGLPLVFSIEDSEFVTLDGSLLTVDPKYSANEKIKLTVTDSSNESLILELHINIDKWWTLNIKRVIIVAIVVLIILILAAFIIRHESNIGYLKVTYAKNGDEELDINEKLNSRRVKLWSLPLSKFISNRVRGVDESLTAERGKITGHLIFGKNITIHDLKADGYELNGETIEKKMPKKLKLRSGESITLVYGEFKFKLTNRN